jgi:hypothetical protein
VNVNVPPEPHGLYWTRQSVRHYDGRVVPGEDPMGRKHFWLTVKPVEDVEEGTDRWAVREGWVDSVGLGRLVLSYPELPLDVIAGRPLARKRVCRTFSDCTTAPRNGLPSGCYPLDGHYKDMEAGAQLRQIKNAQRRKAE